MPKPKIIALVYCAPDHENHYVECAFLDKVKAFEWAFAHNEIERPARRYYITELEVLDWEVDE